MRNTTLFTILLILLLGIFITNSCKKDEETDIPVVSFINPSGNSFFGVGDTINITVKIESVSKINKVEFKITTENNYPITTKKSIITHNEIDKTYQIDLIITDKYLVGGKHKLICIAQNEKDIKTKDLSINISGLDKELLDIAVVTSNGNTTTIYSLPPSLTSSPSAKFTINEANAFTDFSAFYNRIAMAGSVSADANVFEYYNEDSVYRVKNINNSQFPYFTGFQNVNSNMALMYYNGKVEIYNYAGRLSTVFNCNSGYYCKKIMSFDNDIAIIEKKKNSNNESLTFRNNTTYSQYAVHILGTNFIDLFPYESGKAIAFFNDNSKANIQVYDKEQNGFYTPIKFNGGFIRSVAQIDKNNYIFATDNSLMWYRYNVSSITILADNISPQKIHYDQVSSTIYLVSDNSIKRYTFPAGLFIDSYVFTETIIDFKLIYNIP